MEVAEVGGSKEMMKGREGEYQWVGFVEIEWKGGGGGDLSTKKPFILFLKFNFLLHKFNFLFNEPFFGFFLSQKLF